MQVTIQDWTKTRLAMATPIGPDGSSFLCINVRCFDERTCCERATDTQAISNVDPPVWHFCFNEIPTHGRQQALVEPAKYPSYFKCLLTAFVI
jgi:hypothetical protein